MSMSNRSPMSESAPGMTVGWGGCGAASAVGDGSSKLPPLEYSKQKNFVLNAVNFY